MPKAEDTQETEFEDRLNPAVAEFWEDVMSPDGKNTPFGSLKILNERGLELSRRSYMMTERHGSRYVGWGSPGQVKGTVFQTAVNHIPAYEIGNELELESLAKHITTAITGVPEDQLNVHLLRLNEMQQGESVMDNDTEEEMGDVPPYEELDQRLKDEIAKRILMNCLVHGGAVHVMHTAHCFDDRCIETVNRISARGNNRHPMHERVIPAMHPIGQMLRHRVAMFGRIADIVDSLPDTYTVVNTFSHALYWEEDIASVMGPGGATGGSRVDWPDQAGQEPDGEKPPEEVEQKPQVVSEAVNFPVLVQETIKGALEIISQHQFNGMSEEDVRSVLAYADVLEGEVPCIQVGPYLWNNFYRCLPRTTDFPAVMMYLAGCTIEEANRMIELTIDNQDAAKKLISAILKEQNFDYDGFAYELGEHLTENGGLDIDGQIKLDSLDDKIRARVEGILAQQKQAEEAALSQTAPKKEAPESRLTDDKGQKLWTLEELLGE